jgi:hypothetical protein
MKGNSLIIGSWTALLAAVLVWGGVALLAYKLVQLQSERIAFLDNASAANLEQGQAAKLHALVRETENERAVLDAASGVDVLSAVNAIESVDSSGVRVKVVDAQAERSLIAKTSTSSPVNFVILSAHAEGPFSAIMNLVQMLETLPLATTVQAITIGRGSVDPAVKNAAPTWTLNIRLRFLTTTALPS